MNKPILHTLLYGDTGVGKSTMARTFPKPMLVWCFDGKGKEMPYIKGAKKITPEDPFQLNQYDIETGDGSFPIPYRDVIQSDGLIRIEYYHDEDIDNPSAYTKYRHRMQVLSDEYDAWKTVVVDSVTMMELAARKIEEKIINPMQKFAKGVDTRQWFSGSTDALEEMLVRRFAELPMNVIIICHISERRNEISGEILRSASAPGRLASKSLLNANYQEQYYQHTIRDNEGRRHYVLQTTNRDGFAATTQIDAPDPCYPHYKSLWENWEKQIEKIEKAELARASRNRQKVDELSILNNAFSTSYNENT